MTNLKQSFYGTVPCLNIGAILNKIPGVNINQHDSGHLSIPTNKIYIPIFTFLDN
jgi:hypothetical protein